jgi:Flp pilus assembly pilin Flp
MGNAIGGNKCGSVFRRIGRSLGARVAAAARRPQRGAQTTEYMLWVAVIIVVVGAVGVIFKNSLVAFFNSMVYDIGFTR